MNSPPVRLEETFNFFSGTWTYDATAASNRILLLHDDNNTGIIFIVHHQLHRSRHHPDPVVVWILDYITLQTATGTRLQ